MGGLDLMIPKIELPTAGRAADIKCPSGKELIMEAHADTDALVFCRPIRQHHPRDAVRPSWRRLYRPPLHRPPQFVTLCFKLKNSGLVGCCLSFQAGVFVLFGKFRLADVDVVDETPRAGRLAIVRAEGAFVAKRRSANELPAIIASMRCRLPATGALRNGVLFAEVSAVLYSLPARISVR